MGMGWSIKITGKYTLWLGCAADVKNSSGLPHAQCLKREVTIFIGRVQEHPGNARNLYCKAMVES